MGKYSQGDVLIFPSGNVGKVIDTIDGDLFYISDYGELGDDSDTKLFEDNIDEFLSTVVDITPGRCKHWNIELERTHALVGILYDTYGESCGGLLHILTDDDNIDDDDIQFCLNNAEDNKERHEYKISIAIANRYMKHTMSERMCLTWDFLECSGEGCSTCPVDNLDQGGIYNG